MDQDVVAGLDPERGIDQVVRGHALQRQRGGREIVQAVRHGERLVLVDEGELRVAVDALRRGDPVAGGEAGHAFPDFLHGPGGLRTGGEGELHLVDAAALVRVNEVHARGGDLDQQLTGAGNRSCPLCQFQYVGAARLPGNNCVHHGSPCQGAGFLARILVHPRDSGAHDEVSAETLAARGRMPAMAWCVIRSWGRPHGQHPGRRAGIMSGAAVGARCGRC